MAAPPGVTVICVTYQSRDHVAECLGSAVASAIAAGVSTELIVVDNASTDGSADAAQAAFAQAIVIRNDENRGFGAANNQAFRLARGATWLLLNPDARLDEGAMTTLLAALSVDAQLAGVGPSIRGAGVGGAESAGMLPGLRSLAGHFLFVNRLLPFDRGGPWRGWMLRPSRWPRPRAVEWAERRSPPAAAGGDQPGGRVRRGLLPLRRGHGPLRAPPRPRLADCARARRHGVARDRCEPGAREHPLGRRP